MLLEHLAQRILQARKLASLSQTELGVVVHLDGTAISKIEAGKRQVSGLELFRIAQAVKKPLAWFAAADSTVVLSHRNKAGSLLQAQMDDVASSRAEEIRLLRELGTFENSEWVPFDSKDESIEELASRIRSLLGAGTGPLLDLSSSSERLGLFAFTADFGPGVEACYCPLEPGLGVAILNASVSVPPGRRRMNLAHELVHHVFQDAYEITWTEAGSESEKRVQAIAGEVLAPKVELAARFKALKEQGRTVTESVNLLAYGYRASVTQIGHQLTYAGELGNDIDIESLGKLLRIELGIERVVDELPIGLYPKEYERAVARAVRKGLLSLQRAEEMLPGESLGTPGGPGNSADALVAGARNL